jgi:hypothetical protein
MRTFEATDSKKKTRGGNPPRVNSALAWSWPGIAHCVEPAPAKPANWTR